MVLPVQQAHPLQCPLGLGNGVGLVHFPGGNKPLGHILQGRFVQKEVVILEHKGGLAAQAQNVLLAHVGQVEVLPIEGKTSPVGALQKVQTPKQGGLPRAAGTQNSHHISLSDAQVHALQHLQRSKGLGNAAGLQHHAAAPLLS